MKVAKTKSKNQPNTELQRLAQAENYALFQLQGMLGNLVHVHKVVPTKVLRDAIQSRIDVIKNVQYTRKFNRKLYTIETERNQNETHTS